MGVSSPDGMRRIAGIAGVVGAALFLAGDMLFYAHLGSGARYAEGLLATVKGASVARLFAGGLVGPAAACLVIVGFWHVYLNVCSVSPRTGKVLFGASFVFMVMSGAVHLLWASKGLALKFCSDPSSDCAPLLAATKAYWSLAYDLASVPGYLVAALLAYVVLLRKSVYPRWTFVVNPVVWFFGSSLLSAVPAPLGALVVGAAYNLSWVLFFLVSVLTTWRR